MIGDKRQQSWEFVSRRGLCRHFDKAELTPEREAKELADMKVAAFLQFCRDAEEGEQYAVDYLTQREPSGDFVSLYVSLAIWQNITDEVEGTQAKAELRAMLERGRLAILEQGASWRNRGNPRADVEALNRRIDCGQPLPEP